MVTEIDRYFLWSDGAPSHHLLYIDVTTSTDNGDIVFVTWEASFEFDCEEQTDLLNLLSKIVSDAKNRGERRTYIAQAWELVKKIPGIAMQYLPHYELNDKGEFSESLRMFYQNVERNIMQNPGLYVKEDMPYCEGSETILFRLASSEICKKFWRWIRDGTIISVTQDQFQGELSPKVAKYYVEFYNASNRFYVMGFDFPILGWMDTWFILRDDCVPFFFFKKSPLLNLFNAP